MKRSIILLPALLAACNSSPSVTATNASAKEVNAKVAAAMDGGAFISPGHWDGTMTMGNVQMPGMTPEIAARMKDHMSKARSFSSCVTPEQARAPKDAIYGKGEESRCKYDHFTMAGGTIDALMTCGAGGLQQTMTMKGTYAPDAYHMTVATAGKGPDAAQSMSMTMTIDAKRAGACTGKESDKGLGG